MLCIARTVRWTVEPQKTQLHGFSDDLQGKSFKNSGNYEKKHRKEESACLKKVLQDAGCLTVSV